jgi:hypothetical protein
VRLRIAVIVLLAGLAISASSLELTGGVKVGAGGSLLYGGWVQDLRTELSGLGATVVEDQAYLSWRVGGWIETPVLDRFALRLEPCLGMVGGALLASDGYDVLAGVWAIELELPVLGVARLVLPVGSLVLAAGPLVAVAVPVMQTWNNGIVWYEDRLTTVLVSLGVAAGVGYALPVGPGSITLDLRVLAGLLSFAVPSIDGMLNTASLELAAGWEFRPRGAR